MVLATIRDRLARSDLSAKMHARVFRGTRGHVGGEVQGTPVLVLTSEGRRSGKRHEVTQMELEHEGRSLVVPSNAAQPDRTPAWWLNLQARPDAEVVVGGQRRRVRASALTDAERDRCGRVLSSTTRTGGGSRKRQPGASPSSPSRR